MTDGHLNFDTKIDSSGLKKGTKDVSKSLGGIQSAAKKLGGALAAVFSVRMIANFAKETKTLWDAQVEAEAKLETIMRQRMNATDSTIDSIKRLTAAQQELGVIGDEVQLAGAQQIATFLDEAESLEALIPAMNNLLAQQKGLNATASDAVSVGNLIGKVMQGQTSALTRVGVTFTEAQEQVLKYGTEAERAAMLAQVITDNVGEMNSVLAQTDAGRMKQVKNTMADIKEQFGAAVTQIEALFLPALQRAAQLLSQAAQLARELSSALSGVFGTQANAAASVAASTADTADSYADIAASAEDTEEAQEGSLASFDKITKLGNDSGGIDSSTAGSGVLPNTVAATADIETGEAEKKLKAFFSGVKTEFERLFQPLQNAWDNKGQGVIDSAKQSFMELKGLATDVGGSMAQVWTNGTGEEMSEHILGIWTNINGIIGGLTGSFRRAWNEDSLGTSVIQSFADVVNTALGHLETLTGKVAEWSQDVNFEPVLTSIKGVSDALQPLVDTAGDGAEWVWDNILSKIAAWTIEDAVPTAMRTVSQCLGLLNSTAKRLKPVGEWLWDNFLKPMMDFTGAVVIGFLEDLNDLLKDLTDLLDGKTTLSDFTGQLNSMQAAMLAFAGIFTGSKLIGGIKGIATALKALKAPSWISGIAGFVTKYLVPLGKNILAWLSFDVPEILSLGLQGIFVTITSAVAAFFAGWKIGTYLKGILDEFLDFQDAFNIGMDMIVGFFKNAVEKIAGFFADLWDSFKIGGEMIGGFISQDIPQFFSDAKQAIVNIFKNIGKWFSDRWTDIKNVFKAVGSWFKEKFQTAWNGIVGIFTGMGAWFGARWQDVKSIFGSIKSWFKEKFESAYSGITEAFSGIGDFFSDIWDSISSGAKGAVNLVIDALNAMIRGLNKLNFELPDWAPGDLAGLSFGIDIPEIPRLAQGTVVPANYGEFLAVLGDNKREAEIVSPVSAMEEAVMSALVKLGIQRSGTGQKQPIVVQVMLRGKQVGQAVIDDINDRTRATGSSPLIA